MYIDFNLTSAQCSNTQKPLALKEKELLEIKDLNLGRRQPFERLLLKHVAEARLYLNQLFKKYQTTE